MPTWPPERIEVNELVLRRERLGDEAMVAQVVQANVDHLQPWMPWASPAAATVSAQRQRLMMAERAWKAGSDYTFALLEQDETKLLGIFGLHRRIGPQAIEMGYWLARVAVGRGHARAAAAALTAAAMDLCDVRRVEIHCDEANVRSRKVPQRLGYVLDRVEDDEIKAPAEIGRSMIWIFPAQLGAARVRA